MNKEQSLILERCILEVGMAIYHLSGYNQYFSEAEVREKVKSTSPILLGKVRGKLHTMADKKGFLEKAQHTQKHYKLTNSGVERFRELYSAGKEAQYNGRF
jgi:hypothetical protein